MRLRFKGALAAAILAGLLICSNSALAGINLPWSTTFDCTEGTLAQSAGCDGAGAANSASVCGKGTSITTGANNPSGGGGKGVRFWDQDGANVQSSPLLVTFNSPQKELYIRYYIRYQQGYRWNPLNYDKHLYLFTAGKLSGGGAYAAIGEFAWANSYRIYAQGSSGASYSADAGWQGVMGGSQSDGKWHCVEIHVKMDTGGANGVAEMWLDGTRRFSYSNANFSQGNATAGQGWTYLLINSNQSSPSNGTCMYVDFDDIAIRNTGPIGVTGSSPGSSGGNAPQPDKSAPTIPANLKASAASSSQINLSWGASADNIGVAGYRVYRGGVQIATTPQTSYQNTSLAAGTAYSYTVAAYDAAGNQSGQSPAASATTTAATGGSASDKTAPSVPGSVKATVVSPTQIDISWSPSTDNVRVTGYRIYRNGSLVASGMGLNYRGMGLSPSTTYTFAVAAYDAAGNVSGQSASVSATTPASAGGGSASDKTAPSVPGSVKATVVSSSQINLAWSASTDNTGVAGYRVYRGGVQIATTSGTSFQNTSLAAGTTYSYTIAAYDAAGNLSAQSASASATTTGTSSAKLLFQEPFEDNNYASRGWYDNTLVPLSTVEHVTGSARSAEFRWTKGATTPINGQSMRRTFPETDSIYVSYYVKYSAGWQGSNVSYHPHMFYILSNKDGDWDGLAYNYLTTYIEQNEGEPLIAIQDGKNIDRSKINADLTKTTEYRAVAGCNGDSDGYGKGSCYPSGSVYWNGKYWRAGSNYFRDTAGAYYKSDWHFVEAYIKLNSVVNGKGAANGEVTYWFDGNVIMQHKNVMMRTGANADLKFRQFVIAPYIGVGSPVEQSFWIDNLRVATGR